MFISSKFCVFGSTTTSSISTHPPPPPQKKKNKTKTKQNKTKIHLPAQLDCLLDGRVIPEGQVLTLSGGDVCRQCLCQKGSVTCRTTQPSRDCPRLRCSYTATPDGECCPVCAGMSDFLVHF